MINDISTGDADRLGKTNVSAPYAEVWEIALPMTLPTKP